MSYQNQSALSVLISGRMDEDPQILHVATKVVQSFLCWAPTYFYIMNKESWRKISDANREIACKIFDKAYHAKKIDYVVTIGGDGTILYTAKQFLGVSPPFLTFHQGTLGFLCKFTVKDIESAIQKIVYAKKNKIIESKDFPFQICKLIRLQAIFRTTKGCYITKQQKGVVLNQVSITRKSHNKIILQIYVNDEIISTTAGDGILISTSTGSTAYALSAGGPVVFGGVNTILLVPIAPSSLSFRSLCLPLTAIIKIKLSRQSKSNGIASFDGQFNQQISENDQIEIRYQTGDLSNDLIVYENKSVHNDNNVMPTQIQRLKHLLGWNDEFKSPTCSTLKKPVVKLQLPQCNNKID